MLGLTLCPKITLVQQSSSWNTQPAVMSNFAASSSGWMCGALLAQIIGHTVSPMIKVKVNNLECMFTNPDVYESENMKFHLLYSTCIMAYLDQIFVNLFGSIRNTLCNISRLTHELSVKQTILQINHKIWCKYKFLALVYIRPGWIDMFIIV